MKLIALEFPYVDSAALFANVANEPWAIFLDSGVVQGKRNVNKHADFDVLAIRPDSTLVFDNGVSYYQKNKNQSQRKLHGDPMALLQTIIPKYDPLEGDKTFPYLPGALGYFSYDLARKYEDLPTLALNDENLPEMAMGIYLVLVVIDHKNKKTHLLQLGEGEQSQSTLQLWLKLINHLTDVDSTDAHNDLNQNKMEKDRLVSRGFDENLSQVDYRSCFNKIRQYTVDGDCYQVNLAKRFTAEVDGDAWATYQHLRELSPAPYGAYMNLPFAKILSNSPESFIKCLDRNVTTNPIKGTRPRDHADSENDQRIANELLNSPKDRAENLMIVDLMRNDLSRCCELGSVKVPSLFSLHSFANVHHLISTITGTLKSELHSLDLLRRCFPGGSITGAPKIRAMEIIEELEPHRRGLYCGSIGYVGSDGNLQTNIAIRTIVIKGGVARYSAGGGLVVDSDLCEEYQELIDKASMMNWVLSRH